MAVGQSVEREPNPELGDHQKFKFPINVVRFLGQFLLANFEIRHDVNEANLEEGQVVGTVRGSTDVLYHEDGSVVRRSR